MLVKRASASLFKLGQLRCLLGGSSGSLSPFSSLTTEKRPTVLGDIVGRSPFPANRRVAAVANAGKVEMPHSHAKLFAFERYWAAAMVPLFPAAYFVHNPMMDYALAVAVGMHIHWGLHATVEDYARPFLLGETLAKLSRGSIYIVSILMFIGLLHFNYNDVGITKAFEMIWQL